MKALILTGKYAQDIEVFYPFYRMQEEGWDVELAVLGNAETTGVYGMRLTPNTQFPEYGIGERYDVVILPGGARALEYLRVGLLPGVIRVYHERGGVIGSICHGTQLLISAGLVKGRRVSGYYSIKDDIVNAGGEFVDAPFVTDDRICCSPHYKYLGPWMAEVIKEAKRVRNADSPNVPVP